MGLANVALVHGRLNSVGSGWQVVQGGDYRRRETLSGRTTSALAAEVTGEGVAD